MFCCKLLTTFLFAKKLNTKCLPLRNLNVSIIAAANDVGSNLALLMKQNNEVKILDLYDDDLKINGIGLELNLIPGGPEVRSWCGRSSLGDAVRDSHLIVTVHRIPRKPGHTRDQMLSTNAPAVQSLCRSIANENPEAFLAISTNPINSIVPFASALLYKYNCYNPFKIFGITHLDTARARALTAKALDINPLDVSLPVIGGHSEDTIIPLFSNMVPSSIVVDPNKADTLTRLIRRAGTEVVSLKHGKGCASLAVAVGINDFINNMIKAIKGDEIIVNSYTANPNFGTRFFSGPTKVGPQGILQSCHNFKLSDYEKFLLKSSLPLLNRDVAMGEEYASYIETVVLK